MSVSPFCASNATVCPFPLMAYEGQCTDPYHQDHPGFVIGRMLRHFWDCIFNGGTPTNCPSTLKLSSPHVDDEVLTMLSPCSGVKVVDLTGVTDITSKGLENLPSGITRLDLRYKSVTPKDMRKAQNRLEGLATSLNSLTVLSLTENPLGTRGVVKLGKLLQGGHRLKHLYLNRCLIGNNGAKTLAKIISESPSLVYLNLEDNPIDNRGIETIIRALPESSIQYLTLDGISSYDLEHVRNKHGDKPVLLDPTIYAERNEKLQRIKLKLIENAMFPR